MTLVLLDYASVLIFALTGALAASRAQLDLIGFGFIACLTALGVAHCAMCFWTDLFSGSKIRPCWPFVWRPHWSFSLLPRLWKAVTHG